MDITTISKKSKIVLKLCFVLLAVLAIGGLACAFSLNYNDHMPSQPFIINDSNGVLITTSSNENYKGYCFRFTSATGEVFINSDTNTVSEEVMLENGLNVGENYVVSVCYMNSNNERGTDFSQGLSWRFMLNLDQPVLMINRAEQRITWAEVPNADSYTVFRKSGKAFQKQTTTSCYIDYSLWEGGRKEVYVVAQSNKVGYNSSGASNLLAFNHTYKLRELKAENVTFDASKKILTVKTADQLEFMAIYIDGVRSIFKLQPVTAVSGVYTYKVDLTIKYTQGSRIGVAPYPASEFYSFSGQILYLS